MTEKRNGNRFLYVMLALLAVAVAVQGVLLYQLRREHTVGADIFTTADATPTAEPGEAYDDAKAAPHSDPWPSFDWPAFDHMTDTWNPFEEMKRMREQMDRLFGESMNRLRLAPDGVEQFQDLTFSPDMDLREEDDRYVIRFNIPGAEKADIHVEMEDRVLTVSGVTRPTRAVCGTGWPG